MAKHDIPMADFPPEKLIVGGFRTIPVLIKETLRIAEE